MRNAYPPPEHKIINKQPLTDGDWLRVPVGEDSDRWVSLAPQRKVLFVVRTATTLVRLLDLGRSILSDTRIQIVFTIADGRSAFSTGLEDRIRSSGGVYVPWAQARALEFDLAVSLSSNGPLHLIHAPLLLLSHGPGRTKTLGQQAGAGSYWHELLRNRDYPLVIGLANNDETEVFSKEAYEAAHSKTSNVRFEVVGDIMLDELRDTMLIREQLRQRMGVAGRKVVTLSSSWSVAGAFPTSPRLASQLLATLPADEYSVAAILHPNIWIGHGEWQVRTWLADAVDAGLILVPFDGGWQTSVVMADKFVGDHGSVTLYAQLLGIPTARLSNPKDQMRWQLPIVREMAKAPFLSSPHDTYEFCISDTAPLSVDDANAFQKRFIANVGSARETLRSLAYALMGLSPPEHGLARQLPALPPQGKRISTWRVTLLLSDNCLEVVRQPGAVDGWALCDWRHGKRRLAFSALVSSLHEEDYRMLQTCDIALVDQACLMSGRWRRACPNACVAAAAINDQRMLVRDKFGKDWRVESITGQADPYTIAAVAAYAIMRQLSTARLSLAKQIVAVELRQE